MITSKKLFYILLAGVLLVGIGTGAIVYYGSTILRNKGDELSKLKVTEEVLANRQVSLQQAKLDIDKYENLEQIAKAIVPHEKNQAQTILEITAIANKTGIPLPEISFGQSDLGVTDKKPAASKLPVNKSGTTQVIPIPGTNGLYAMDISIRSDTARPVTYEQFLNFLDELSKNRRTAHITSLSIQPDDTNRELITFSAKLNVYIKP